MRKTGIEKACAECGKLCYVPAWRLARFRYCSGECQYKNQKGKPRVGVILTCEQCAKPFYVAQHRIKTARFCSLRCGLLGHPEVIEKAKAAAIEARRKRAFTPDQVKQRRKDANKRYYQKHKADHSAAMKAYYEANKVEHRKRTAAWNKANPEKARAIRLAIKARRREAEGSHTSADLKDILRLQRGRCAICRKSMGDKWTVDHIVPIARGGSNWRSNIQLVHRACNLSKRAHDPIEHMRALGRLI